MSMTVCTVGVVTGFHWDDSAPTLTEPPANKQKILHDSQSTKHIVRRVCKLFYNFPNRQVPTCLPTLL